MGYNIIFQTKIVDLEDGRIVWFDRSGCNNDTAGREKNIFTAQIIEKDKFTEIAKKYMQNSKPYRQGGDFDMIIGSRSASAYDYGMHLLRMLKRAENMEQFAKNNYFHASELVCILVTKPIRKEFTPSEFDKVFYDLLYRSGEYADIPRGGLTYKRIFQSHNKLSDIIPLIEKSAPVEFYIKKW